MGKLKDPALSDGVVKIYAVANTAADGQMPVESLTLKQTLRYKERTVGVRRYYAALQANVRIEYLLRVPQLRDVSTQDVAIPNDGQQYRIDQIQHPEELPDFMDLTLTAVSAVYPILTDEEDGEDGEPGEDPDGA